MQEKLEIPSFKGELFHGAAEKIIYATDASAYRELPEAVAIPKTDDDIKSLINFARKNKTSLIPRTAGTSLAGQVVGNGIIVDVSKHFNKILEINAAEKWVRVQPGVIRDDLNKKLKSYGLFFAPETSTANRAMIGGMIGNNSCGSNSIKYGTTRDHLLEVKGLLSDGNFVHFKPLDNNSYKDKTSTNSTLEHHLYNRIDEILTRDNIDEIRKEFPRKSIKRRNTGYSLDALADNQPFSKEGKDFNMCRLIAGSEGTLMFITEAKLNLVDLPAPHKRLICIHCESIDESLRANIIAVGYQPTASELMDHYILECTSKIKDQQQNRFFIEGAPNAILIVELTETSREMLDNKTNKLIAELKSKNLGYSYPIVAGDDIPKVWSLRKSGLGSLANIPGDEKAVPVIEDTAVDVKDLPDYIAAFNQILEKYGLYSVHYAHAGSGELHLRPIINLKVGQGQALFKIIAKEVAALVKKYEGSLSGEHGDGRLRGEFIPEMVGKKNYQLFKAVKLAWDPDNIFNPGKIVDTPSMNSHLRYDEDQSTPDFDTYFDFSSQNGLLRAAEQCNGSGDCRKSELSGGTMCPSYMATRNEKDTTRARANILREFLTRSTKINRFDHVEIKEVMDLCLSCKGCKSECPSNVDLARLKAEFTQQYHDVNGTPFRSRLIGNYALGMQLASNIHWAFNAVFNIPVISDIAKEVIGFAPKRSMPTLPGGSLKKWYAKNVRFKKDWDKQVYMFFDEFTNYLDVSIGIKAIELLNYLGYQVKFIDHPESGRSYISKGMLKEAKKLAQKNVEIFSGLVNDEAPLIGIEPSAILSFRDEYPALLRGDLQKQANKLADNVLLIDEFLSNELDKGRLTKEKFVDHSCEIKLHGHCHQKAMSSLVHTKKILSFPENYSVQIIPSGCCGMAGSFGYEKEHFNISMDIGELVLFPTIRSVKNNAKIAAPGTSCRHQIKDGTGVRAYHPVELLWEAVKKD
ncbi:MAG TPA: FAD-binding and (Fe-S)-binding domain-containing protein [Cyclobacteriaceae bacterium]